MNPREHKPDPVPRFRDTVDRLVLGGAMGVEDASRLHNMASLLSDPSSRCPIRFTDEHTRASQCPRLPDEARQKLEPGLHGPEHDESIDTLYRASVEFASAKILRPDLPESEAAVTFRELGSLEGDTEDTERHPDHDPQSLCADCGVDTTSIVDGLGEFYMVRDLLWIASGFGKSVACIGCLENRLGRRLNSRDFGPDVPANGPFKNMTPRLLHRLSHLADGSLDPLADTIEMVEHCDPRFSHVDRPDHQGPHLCYVYRSPSTNRGLDELVARKRARDNGETPPRPLIMPTFDPEEDF